MSTFTVSFKTDSSAFDGESLGFETARILRKIADRAEEGYTAFSLTDSNGNTVGLAQFTEDNND